MSCVILTTFSSISEPAPMTQSRAHDRPSTKTSRTLSPSLRTVASDSERGRMYERLPGLCLRTGIGCYRLAAPFATSTWVAAVFAVCAATATVLLPAQPLAQQAVERPQSLLELIDPKVF